MKNRQEKDGKKFAKINWKECESVISNLIDIFFFCMAQVPMFGPTGKWRLKIIILSLALTISRFFSLHFLFQLVAMIARKFCFYALKCLTTLYILTVLSKEAVFFFFSFNFKRSTIKHFKYFTTWMEYQQRHSIFIDLRKLQSIKCSETAAKQRATTTNNNGHTYCYSVVKIFAQWCHKHSAAVYINEKLSFSFDHLNKLKKRYLCARSIQFTVRLFV